ncbi:MAG: DUF924 domain-containing protein [Proteobacteria bacterium]|nr:MAG: DUF924 domain-containing protein [Pseudomonadota bacterium]
MNYQDVLQFWFGEEEETPAYQKEKSRLWFGGEPATDAEIKRRFGAWVEEAAAGKLREWEQRPASCLALVILLDQFPLNIYRDKARSYELCDLALPIAIRAVDRKFDKELSPMQRSFLYLPFEHAEDLELQRRSVALFRNLLQDSKSSFMKDWMQGNFDYAERHLKVVERFGRFPHRNEALGRLTTPEEKAFLAEGRPF